MSFSNTVETEILEYVFNGTVPSWAGNTNFWIGLATADPGEIGTAVTNEATYGGYARKLLTRSTDFTVTGDTVENTSLEQFDPCTSGSNVITWAFVADTSSGAGKIIARAQLSSSITVNTGVQPQFAAGALSFTLD